MPRLGLASFGRAKMRVGFIQMNRRLHLAISLFLEPLHLIHHNVP
jgi:hypothetical protein